MIFRTDCIQYFFASALYSCSLGLWPVLKCSLVGGHKIHLLTNTLYEGNSKINLRLVGKKHPVVIAPKRKLSSNKLCLLSLNVYPHTFLLRSVGVITDETLTLLLPLPPAVRYVLWFVFFTQKDSKGILLTEFMAPGITIISEVYCEMLYKLQRSN
jgi:hypothetical protein